MDKTRFGSYIKEARINKQYTQQELANLLFVDVSTVSKWERGISYPDITLIADICRILDVSEHELIASTHDTEYRKIKKDAAKYNNMKKGTFWALNISYLTALIVCFIVDIAVNKTLSWFFIVLSSLICAYTFCPTITWLFSKGKKAVFVISTFASMSLLFLTCSVYTRNYWFMIAVMGVLIGYFIVFYPGLFKNQKKYLEESKYNKLSRFFLLSYVSIILILIILLLIFTYLYVPFNLKMGLMIVGVCFVIPVAFGILNSFEISKSLNKPILLSLIGVFVILILAGLGRAVYLKTTEAEKAYNIEQIYSGIKIASKNADINIYLSQTNENKIVYTENKKIKFDSKIVDGVLMLTQIDERKFYDKLFNFSDFDINLYLTQDFITSLNIDSATGDIEINEGFTFDNIEIINSTGDVELKANVNNNIKIINSTGDIEIENANVGGNVNVKTSTGDIDLTNLKCNTLDIKISTGNTELNKVKVEGDFNMEGRTGDVRFDDFDAANIYVTVSTGNVKGTISTNKIFNAKSDTGSVDVPETYTGGICKIVTDTGNIRIRYR